ncbi:MAG: GNAT family N-acetyltransferase [bacterium]|nr:GNAT family N-acetyltransferase [bacterium]MDZ4231597.1 GNAT family N-acetyltransferase [Patescibacteria group bacterium]
MRRSPDNIDSTGSGSAEDALTDVSAAEETPYVLEVFEPTPEGWAVVKDAVVKLETDEFGEEAFEPELLEEDFLKPENTVVILREASMGEIIGFTYAEPLASMDERDLRQVDREDDGEKTAYVSDTVIAPTHRGRRLVGRLTGKLAEELAHRGFGFLERDAAVVNNYADNIIKNNEQGIIYAGEPEESKYGPQRFIRMRIDKHET